MSALERAAQVGAVAGLAIFWALNWPMMKLGLEVVEPWTFRALVVMVGGIGCLGLAYLFGQGISVPKRDMRPLLLVGITQGILWNAFSGFGISLVEAGRAAVLAFTMPVWVTLLAAIFLHEPLTGRRLIGLLLGMGGLALLLVPALEALNAAAFGALLMVCGAVSWAVSTIIVKGARWDISPLVLAGWQFIIGGVPLTLAAFTIGAPSTLLAMDGRTAAAVTFSAVVPMIFCQAIFFAIVRRLPVTLASMSTLLVPPLGVFFSAMILGEQVGLAEALSLVLVVGALVFVMPGFSWRAIRRRQPASRPG
ncbi:MAG: DMT family transporter [Pseudomonadota bacterium]